jgi:hypothetical protein
MQAIRRLTAGTLAGGAVGTFFVSLDGTKLDTQRFLEK